jgi:hypothetical protein
MVGTRISLEGHSNKEQREVGTLLKKLSEVLPFGGGGGNLENFLNGQHKGMFGLQRR